MAKRRREPDSDDTATEMTELNTVFVDTSLDTHIAMLVSSSDTVLDFKKKIVLEHKQCFPDIGEIRIDSVKVKRRSNFYHLPDIMLVWSAFHGVKGNWFISADASPARICHLIKNSSGFDASNGVKMGLNNVDNNCIGLSSDVNRIQILPTPLLDGPTEKDVVSEMITGFKFEKSVEKTTDFCSNICSEENCMGTESHLKKKHKMKHTEDACPNPSLGESGKDISIPEIVGCGNSMVNAVKESPAGGILHEKNGKSLSDATAKVSFVRNDQFDAEDRLVFEGTSPPTTEEKSNLVSINLLASDERKEDNVLESKMDNEVGQDAPTEHSGGVSVKVPDGRLIAARGAVGEVNTDVIKRKKKKVKKTARKSQDITDMEQTGKAESTKPCSEIHKTEKKEEEKGLLSENHHEVIMPSNSEALDHVDPDLPLKEADADGSKWKKKKVQKKAGQIQDITDMDQTGKGESMKIYSETHECERKKEEKSLPPEHHHEVIIPSNSKTSDHVNPDLALKEVSVSQDAAAVMDPEISSGIKKKKKKKRREKKSVDSELEKAGVEQTDNGISRSSGLLLPSPDHIPEETGKEESIMHHEGKDVQVKMLENCTLDVREKVRSGNENEADFVILSQTVQSLEGVGTGDKKTDKETRSSAVNFHADCPAVETENPIKEFSEVDKGNEITENKDRKASKKRKKRKQTASDVQENLPVEDHKVDFEALATKETTNSYVNSEQEGRHVDSAQVLYRKTEEKLNEMHGIAENIDVLAKTSEKEREGINFKQYFVPGEYQDKVDSDNKVNRATMSNQEMRTSNKIKDNGISSVSNSTELQNSIKSFENKKAENKSRRKGSGRSKGDSVQNSDRDEMIPKSFRSSGASAKGVKDSSPSEMCTTRLQKPNEILPASSCLNQKNLSLDISSSERSEILPRKHGSKRSPSGLNVTNMMLIKTPQKKSLLTKAGAIFQDNSGESSGDENGTMQSDGSTLSPSDSSSMSDYSVGENDMIQDSTRNGSNDAEGGSNEQRNMSKLDLSASKDMTMDMILRSSKRFKKAKLMASQNEDEQNESQPIEFVPDSQHM